MAWFAVWLFGFFSVAFQRWLLGEVYHLEATFEWLVVLLIWETLSDCVVGCHNDFRRTDVVQHGAFNFGSERIVVEPRLEVVSHVLTSFWVSFFDDDHFFVVVSVPPFVDSL